MPGSIQVRPRAHPKTEVQLKNTSFALLLLIHNHHVLRAVLVSGTQINVSYF